jgi:hypothetical protein
VEGEVEVEVEVEVEAEVEVEVEVCKRDSAAGWRQHHDIVT